MPFILLIALLPILNIPVLTTEGTNFGGVMAQFGMYALIAIGLNVVVGQAGLLDLGYVGFYAVGAYTVALLTSPNSPWNQTGPDGWLSTDWAWLAVPADRHGDHRDLRPDPRLADPAAARRLPGDRHPRLR